MFKTKKRGPKQPFKTEKDFLMMCILIGVLVSFTAWWVNDSVSQKLKQTTFALQQLNTQKETVGKEFVKYQQIHTFLLNSSGTDELGFLDVETVLKRSRLLAVNFGLTKNQNSRNGIQGTLVLFALEKGHSLPEIRAWFRKMKEFWGWNNVALISVQPMIFDLATESLM